MKPEGDHISMSAGPEHIAVATYVSSWTMIWAALITGRANKEQPFPEIGHIRFDRIESELRKWTEYAERVMKASGVTEEQLIEYRKAGHNRLLDLIAQTGGQVARSETHEEAHALTQAMANADAGGFDA